MTNIQNQKKVLIVIIAILLIANVAMLAFFLQKKEPEKPRRPDRKTVIANFLKNDLGFNQQQFDWYKKLVAIRKRNPVLSTGKIEFIITEGKKLGYRRYDGRNELIVLFNLEKNKQDFKYITQVYYVSTSGTSTGLPF